MKKGLEKLLSIAMFVIGLILIILLMLTVFGTLQETTLANEVVRSMIIGLSLLFLICAAVMIGISFKDSDVLKAVVLSSERASTTRVSLSVVRNVVTKNAKHIKGLKVSGIALLMDENNLIRMKLTVKITENDVDVVVDRFRCLLFDAFYELLGVEFSSIDFKVKALSPKYAPDMNKIDRAAMEIKEKREKLMFEKLKVEEEESHFEEQRKEEAEKRRKEEARLRREREDQRKRERELHEAQSRRIEDIADGAEELPVFVTKEDYEMPLEIASVTETTVDGDAGTNFDLKPIEEVQSVSEQTSITEIKRDAPPIDTLFQETVIANETFAMEEVTNLADRSAETEPSVTAEDKNEANKNKNTNTEDK